MSDDALKKPFARSQQEFVANKIDDALFRQPKELPCHVTAVNGQTVTVAFDINFPPFTLPTVTMPKAQSKYAIEPTQPGDKGFAVACDFYLGGQSGLGGGTATGTQQGNLSNLVFQPISNTGDTSPNVNAYVVQGPEGVILRDIGGKTTFVLTPTGWILTDTTNGTVVTSKAGVLSVNPGSGDVILGGDGTTGSYEAVQSVAGPAMNVKVRTA